MEQQAKSTDLPEQFSDLLLLMDNEKKNIRVVKGVGKDGEPETVAPTKEKNNEFLRLDSRGDVFSNFFSNFLRQIKDPTRFRFFRVSDKIALEVAKFMQKHLDEPTPLGEQIMKQYEVLQEKKEEQQNVVTQNNNDMETKQKTTTEQVPAGQEATTQVTNENQNEQNNRYRFQEDNIEWSLLERLGLGKERFESLKILDPLLRGFKSNKLVKVSFNLVGMPIRFDARISFQQNKNGQVVPAFHGIRREPNFDFPYYGHEFSEEDKKNLKTDGNMGRVVNLTNPRTGEVKPSLISLDKLTNELVAVPTAWVTIKDELSNVKLTPKQKKDLAEGKALYLKGMVSQKGQPFESKVQYNADKRYVEYLSITKTPKVSAEMVEQNPPKEAPKVFAKKELTAKQYEKFNEGQPVFVRGLVDKKGEKYDGYITYDKQKGITNFSFEDPRKMQGQATVAESHKTQKAVNSDGKTNEATKNTDEPLSPKQVAPKNEKQQREQQQPAPRAKSKGVRM